MPVSPDSQGYLGSLYNKSLPELKEILDRQESILKKQHFVTSLPDKGRKIQEFAETLQRVINQKEEIHCRSKALSETKLFNTPSTTKTASKFKQERCSAVDKDKSECAGTIKTDVEKCFVAVERDAVHLGGSEEDRVFKTGVDTCHTELEDFFQRLNVSNVGDSGDDKPVPNPYVNSYEVVIKRGEEQERNKRKPFKVNRTLNVEKVDELPEKFKYHKQDEGMVESNDERPTNHISVLESEDIFPKYKYDKAKQISITESLKIQQAQKEKQETLKTEQAVENLSQKLNCDMHEYGSKEIDMKYRETVPELDSDDDLDPEFPEID